MCCHSLMSAIRVSSNSSDRSGTSDQSCHYYYLQARHDSSSIQHFLQLLQCCREAWLPPCLHVNNAPEGERQKSVSRSSLVCHLPSPCISPDRQPPLKQGENTATIEPSAFLSCKSMNILHICNLTCPSPHFFTNSQTVCICISHAGLIRRRSAMQQQPGPSKRGGCHGDPTQGHLLSFRFFFPLFPTFNDAAAACLGSVYFSVQHHDSQSRL